jgi:hypothetical protein
VVDTSGAYIPGHGTPTVILLARCRSAKGKEVWAIQGKRGEPKRPEVAEDGLVWSAIRAAGIEPDDSSPFVSVAQVERRVFTEHPWSLGGGAVGELTELMMNAASSGLRESITDSGFFGVPNADEVLQLRPTVIAATSVESVLCRPMVNGDGVRDYFADAECLAFVPYSASGEILQIGDYPNAFQSLWCWRTTLWARGTFSRNTYRQEGLPWWRWHQIRPDRGHGLRIKFAFVATHNHYVLERDVTASPRTAPVIKLPANATLDDHLDLLGLLNSSTLGFWMKQTFFNKGASSGGAIRSEDWDPLPIEIGNLASP